MDFNSFFNIRWMLGDVDGLIKRGFTSTEKYCKKLLQITHMPAFEPIVNWEIFKVDDGMSTEYFMVKTFWNRNEDWEKWCNLHSNFKANNIVLGKRPINIEPTIVNKKFELQNDFVENLINKLEDIKISPFPCKCLMGCDGTSYKLALEHSQQYINIGWWENGPENWAELTIFISEIISIFDKISEIAIETV